MSVTAIYSAKEKPGWTYDRKKKQWRGYLLDCYKFDGFGKPLKRVRVQYARHKDATDAELEIEIEKQNARAGIFKPKHSEKITLKSLLDKHAATYPHRKRRILADRVYKTLLALLPDDILVTELKTADLQKFVEERLKHVGAKTVNHELSVITPALKSAYLYFAELEDWQLPRIPHQSGANRRRERIVTDSEQKKLLDYLRRTRESDELEKNYFHRHRLADWIEFKVWTGFRRKEIAALKKTAYDAKEQALLNVWRYKTKKPTAFFPLSRRAVEIIEHRIKLQPESEFIFTPDGKPIESNYRTLKEVCKELKIPYGQRVTGGFVLHDLKRNFATNLQQVTDIATLKELTSNSSDTLNVYLNTSHKQMKDAMRSMENLNSPEELKKIFYAIQNKEMDFEEFVRRMR